MSHLRIGKLRAYEESEVKYIQHSEDTRTLRPGDIIKTFDHICEWDEDCVSFDVCKRSVCFFSLSYLVIYGAES